jgi:hypothetical protein
VPGIWYLLRRRGWSCPPGARRTIERDDGAVEVWKKAWRTALTRSWLLRSSRPVISVCHCGRHGQVP